MLRLTGIFLLGFVTTALSQMEGFIVGGKFGIINQHPHSAFLSVNCVSDNGKKAGWICGSSLVNQQILLTAGHCIYGCTSESHIGINLGDAIRHNGMVYSTYSFVIHENYNPRTSASDICLLRANKKIMLNKQISRVAIMKMPPYNENAVVAGWGMIDEIRETQSERLKYVTQRVWSRNQCLQVFRYLLQGTFCAASDNQVDYASQGDSGSALVVRGYIQIGLVSYKIPTISRHVIIYTDLGYYFDWIQNYARQLACNGRKS